MFRRALALTLVSLAGCSFDARGRGGVSPGDAETEQDTAYEEPDTAVPADAAVDDSGVADTAIEETKDASGIFDTPSPLPGCTVGFREGHDYLFCERNANWDQARTTCQIAGYDLVVVNDADEHAFILGHLKGKSKNEFHIGLTDRASEGDFKWVDGSALVYKRWASWQPDDFWFNEDCTVVRKDGTWNDVNCTGGPTEGFVCESR